MHDIGPANDFFDMTTEAQTKETKKNISIGLSQNLKFLYFKELSQQGVYNLQNRSKYLQIIYLIKDYYLEYIEKTTAQ